MIEHNYLSTKDVINNYNSVISYRDPDMKYEAFKKRQTETSFTLNRSGYSALDLLKLCLLFYLLVNKSCGKVLRK